MSIRIGQQVVCVDADWTQVNGRPELHKGQVYTARWVGVYSDHYFVIPELCIRVQEIFRHCEEDVAAGFPDDMPFRASRFRPVKETDISIFTAMLAPTPKQRVRIEG